MTTSCKWIIYICWHLIESILILMRLNSVWSTDRHSLICSMWIDHCVRITTRPNTFYNFIWRSRLVWSTNRCVSNHRNIIWMSCFSDRICKCCRLRNLSLLSFIIAFLIVGRIMDCKMRRVIKIGRMSRLRSKFSMFEKRRTIEISRIYTIFLNKISSTWICVLHHRLNYSVEAKTGIRNSLINSRFFKLFINYHRIAKAGFIFWVACSSVWLSTNHLISISCSWIYINRLWNSSVTTTCTWDNSILFSFLFHYWILRATFI